jgi:3-methyl-2-oxobutanoate hydroxymethyltransferase
VTEVKEGVFPDDDHTYNVSPDEYERFATMVEKRKHL